ncbi:SbcC-like subunit of palindrome specific endonuclease [Morganella phage vB_MmoM_MP1]|uniref:Recombination endonuclease subunit n=1 Tax=Morganella phage vB_MmoM_MP1 TaxID=1852628 RepID=A0A192YBB5_9CAUD|nr:SbcC-like subunit of palindrome specific endonuclease [Morganella phage vB_MmoM_MP1]ANM46410.1 recombination endonuclease subunit [Morganella phage vB_MmoM_MP1]
MKAFKLNKIKYKNILSIGATPVEIDLDAHHKTLITGTNGAGKSTMLEAICFALFGKPFRDIKKGMLINSINKKDMLVELWFNYGKDSYYIKRGQKPNIFEVKKNNQSIDEDASVKDFQDRFEQMIGMNMQSFKSTVVLGTAGYTPFMQLKPADRRTLVEDLLKTNVLAVMDKLNKTEIREINQKVSIVDVKKEGLDAQLKAQEEFAENQKKMSDDNISRYRDLYNQQVEEAKATKQKIAELTAQLDQIVIGDDPSPKYQEIASKITKINTEQSTLEKVVKLYDHGGACPTCRQELSDKSQVDSINDKIGKLSKGLKLLTETSTSLKSEVQEYNRVVAEYNRIKQEIASTTQTLIKTVEQAKRINTLIENASQEKIDNSDKIVDLQKDINVIVKEKSDLLMEKYQRGFLTDMLKDSGIKGAIISKYVPLFNKQINHYLKLLGGDYLFTLDEEFNETIKSRGRESFSYYSFSQGEKARIDIALLFTWRDIASKVSGVKISTMFLDEIFDGPCDVEAIKGINKILSEMTEQNIFIISHGDHNPEDYGQHIIMKKVGRFSVRVDNED